MIKKGTGTIFIQFKKKPNWGPDSIVKIYGLFCNSLPMEFFKKTYRVLCNELFIIQILQYSMLLYITGISFNQKLKADVKILWGGSFN